MFNDLPIGTHLHFSRENTPEFIDGAFSRQKHRHNECVVVAHPPLVEKGDVMSNKGGSEGPYRSSTKGNSKGGLGTSIG